MRGRFPAVREDIRRRIPQVAIDWRDFAAIAGIALLAVSVAALLGSWAYGGLILAIYLLLLARS